MKSFPQSQWQFQYVDCLGAPMWANDFTSIFPNRCSAKSNLGLLILRILIQHINMVTKLETSIFVTLDGVKYFDKL
jgi:hypothetical protein